MKQKIYDIDRNMEKTLVIMAAGLWSRYGGLKQVDSFWPNGEWLLEYSIYDAISAGCTHVVLVIQPQHQDLFEEKFTKKIQETCKISFVHQEKTTLIPKSISIDHRLKPRGSAHAILVCKDVVRWPCIVINADDWYWREWFWLLFEKLWVIGNNDFAMVWYPIENTVPSQWTVNRGVCKTNSNNEVVWIREHHAICYKKWVLIDDEDSTIELWSVVSMNFRGFNVWIFDLLEEEFAKFLDIRATDPKKEYYISTVTNKLIKEWTSTCYLLISGDKWSWVTNKEDKPILQDFLNKKVENWYYPQQLWNK